MSSRPRLRAHLIAFLIGAGIAATALVGYRVWRHGSQDAPGELATVTVYKSPTCGCCAKWVDHLRENGFPVQVEDREDMPQVKKTYSVPEQLSSCHTARVGEYTVEVHVPAADIQRLLREKPEVAGLAVPGMPVGSPGMEEGDRRDPFDVLAFTAEGGIGIFSHYRS